LLSRCGISAREPSNCCSRFFDARPSRRPPSFCPIRSWFGPAHRPSPVDSPQTRSYDRVIMAMPFAPSSRWIARSALGIVFVAGLNLAFISPAPPEQAPAQAAPKPSGGACPTGYVVKGGACEDVNECATNNGGCTDGSQCVNTPGAWQCGSSCPPGFTGTPAAGCQDVNECATGNGGCDTLTMCKNTPGGRTCGECPEGHAGDGYIGCVDVNECADGDCSGILERRARQRDSIPPVVTTPGTVNATANSSAGAAVTFTVSAKDNVDGVVPVLCSPASGSTFPVGTTTVTCTAADKRGNKGAATIAVTVVQPKF
jgi:hypothetical protein